MNSIQKIESAVYAIRPELKKQWHSRSGLGSDYFCCKCDSYCNQNLCVQCSLGSGYNDFYYDPITLSDILLCLGEKSTQLEYCLTNKGNFYKTDGDIVGALLCSYNLRLSPYEQSEEVKDFIANNIVGTN